MRRTPPPACPVRHYRPLGFAAQQRSPRRGSTKSVRRQGICSARAGWVRIDQLVSAGLPRIGRFSLEDCGMSEEVQHEHRSDRVTESAAAGASSVNLTPKAIEMVKQMHAKEGLSA